jgi:hypothetical protein
VRSDLLALPSQGISFKLTAVLPNSNDGVGGPVDDLGIRLLVMLGFMTGTLGSASFQRVRKSIQFERWHGFALAESCTQHSGS